MDEIAQKANQARSSRGSKFENSIEEILLTMRKNNKIKDYTRSPIIFDGEFNPDFIIEKNNKEIISLDSTTTARTDRLRGKQWDAHGTKKYFKEEKEKEITAAVVVKDTEISKAEKDNFRRCKSRCTLPHSALDNVFSIEELINKLKK